VNTTFPTVLVADDDPSIREMLSVFLSGEQYNVLLAADGREALDLFMHTPGVSVVLIDLVMPNREGIETIQAIRRSRVDVKIVAMSGAFEGQLLPVAECLGADMTLDKPINLEALRDALSVLALRGTDHHRARRRGVPAGFVRREH
jgi:CheY-like chemotaxis protein